MLPSWTQRARNLDEVLVEIAFPVRPDFYFGPENRFTEEMWERMREPLYAPAVAAEAPHLDDEFARRLLTGPLQGSADELIRYYSDVLRLIEKHRKKVINHRGYFTLEPILYSPAGDFELRFILDEHWETAALMLSNLENQRDGMLYDAIDEGWALEVLGSGDRLYIRLGDPEAEAEEDGICISCERRRVVDQIAPLRERTRIIRRALTTAFPVDYWSLQWLHRAWGVPHRSWMDEVDSFGTAPSTPS